MALPEVGCWTGMAGMAGPAVQLWQGLSWPDGQIKLGQGMHYVVWAVLFVVADNDLLYHVALIAVGADITSYVDQSDVVVIIEIKDKFGG